LPKPTQKSSNTASISREKTSSKQKYASQAECEAAIDAAFANGVPSEYKSIYNQQLRRLEKIQTNTSSGQVITYLHSHMVNQDPIICRGITHHLKECENASSILPQIAVYAAREKSKERDCGTYLEKDIILDFSVGSDHYTDMIYK
jgi:nitric oxide synthase oxygenase domain/subunit